MEQRTKRCGITLFIILLLFIPQIIYAESTSDNHGFDTGRSIANFMETHYEVTILIGSECDGVTTGGFTIGEKAKGRTPFMDAAGLFNYTEETQMIDDAFAIYPPEFFTRFKCNEAPKGLRILLPNQIVYEGQTMSGVTTVEDGYYNIFLGIGAFTELNIHHEIWHAMEYRITNEYPDAFSGWNQLNPEGFTYSEDYLEQDIWEQAEPKDDWFVRGYSTIDEMEDRATVIEAIFRYDDDWWAAHPHIEKKRDFLLDAAEPVFGPVYYHE